MVIKKSPGVTDTERLLAGLCEQTFLKLWSYPNPYKDDGHELCDLIVVFDDQIFIFFDRAKKLLVSPERDPRVLWARWNRRVVDAQTNTAHGAERYLRSGREVFIDGKKTTPFPLPIDMSTATVHKIVVAHGAADACLASSESNVSGSLAVSYSDDEVNVPFPFFISISSANPVHVLDTHTLPLVLAELDTISDLAQYLNAKCEAVTRLQTLAYCGEEDLLAHYLANYDEVHRRHYIGSLDHDYDSVMIPEGEWKDFTALDVYKQTKEANRISYLWDDVIQRTAEYAFQGTTIGSSPLEGRGAIQEMAREPRFVRRALSENMVRVIREFPDNSSESLRHLSFMPSIDPKKAYVFLQLKAPKEIRDRPNYREIRQNMLLIACGAAKNRYMDLQVVVGILIEAPKFSDDRAEDFVVLYCSEWDEESRTHYQELSNEFGFFKTGSEVRKTVQEFVREDDFLG